MKTLYLIVSLAFSSSSFAQQVKFREGQLENGMAYPILEYPTKRSAELAINKDIEAQIEKYKADDFCIGAYGYVQKTGFLQVHIYANCISMDESENNYSLYDLETGKTIEPSFLVDPKQESKFKKFLIERSRKFIEANSIEDENGDVNSLTMDDFDVVLEKKGLLMTCHKISTWGSEVMLLEWSDLQAYLKISYI